MILEIIITVLLSTKIIFGPELSPMQRHHFFAQQFHDQSFELHKNPIRETPIKQDKYIKCEST